LRSTFTGPGGGDGKNCKRKKKYKQPTEMGRRCYRDDTFESVDTRGREKVTQKSYLDLGYLAGKHDKEVRGEKRSFKNQIQNSEKREWKL